MKFAHKIERNDTLEYPSWSSPSWPPDPICFDEGICQFDKLSHEGGECDLGGFSGSPEFVVDCPEVRVEAHGDKGWHVERVAQVFASALECRGSEKDPGDRFPDARLAIPLSGLARHGCQTGEARHLFAIHGSDLWHLDQHGRLQ